MKSLRELSVAKARETGICSQCLKLRTALNRMQCQRCINTNRRKQQHRRDYPELRGKVLAYAVKIGACTRCLSRRADKPNKNCRVCLDYKKLDKARTKKRLGIKTHKKRGRPKGSRLTPEQLRANRRASNKKYRAKKLYKKVRSLDIIKHAVAKGKPVPTKGE